jgi:hypothetical protein
MIKDILGDLVPAVDVEPIDPGCGCGCGCMTKSALAETGASAAVVSR